MGTFTASPADLDVIQETLLGEALEHGPVGAIVLDETGRFLAANREACRLTRYSREEFLRLTPSDLAADATVIPARLRQMELGTLVQAATVLKLRDGSLLPVEYRVGATRAGGLPYFVFLFWERAAEQS